VDLKNLTRILFGTVMVQLRSALPKWPMTYYFDENEHSMRVEHEGAVLKLQCWLNDKDQLCGQVDVQRPGRRPQTWRYVTQKSSGTPQEVPKVVDERRTRIKFSALLE
jgi:hypothetical protein